MVSIVLLATPNDLEGLKKSINSIRNQSFEKWELLVGFTIEINLGLEDSRVSFFNFDNLQSKAEMIRFLLSKSRYPYISLLKCGHIWSEDKLDIQLSHIQDYDFIGSNLSYPNKDKTDLSEDYYAISEKILNKENAINSYTSLVRKDCLENFSDSQVKGFINHDFDLLINLLKSNYTFYNIPEVLVQDCYDRS
jgi:hypothetical protein